MSNMRGCVFYCYLSINALAEMCEGIHVSVCEGIHMSVCDSIQVSVCEGIHVSVCEGIHVSVYEGIHVSVCKGIHVSVCVVVNHTLPLCVEPLAWETLFSTSPLSLSVSLSVFLTVFPHSLSQFPPAHCTER